MIKVSIILVVTIIPFWLGREFAIPALLKNLLPSNFGYRLLFGINWPLSIIETLAWLVVVLASLLLLDIIISDILKYPKRWLLLIYAMIQFLSGFAFLRTDFKNRNLVVYVDQADKADAIDYGLIAGVVGFLLYVIVFILVMTLSRKNLQWSFRSKPTLIYMSICQIIVLMFSLFGPLHELVHVVL
jgi:hypothetical protein